MCLGDHESIQHKIQNPTTTQTLTKLNHKSWHPTLNQEKETVTLRKWWQRAFHQIRQVGTGKCITVNAQHSIFACRDMNHQPNTKIQNPTVIKTPPIYHIHSTINHDFQQRKGNCKSVTTRRCEYKHCRYLLGLLLLRSRLLLLRLLAQLLRPLPLHFLHQSINRSTTQYTYI